MLLDPWEYLQQKEKITLLYVAAIQVRFFSKPHYWQGYIVLLAAMSAV